MGSVADGIIDGLFCENCGTYIDGEAVGYPRYCGSCEEIIAEEENLNEQ